MVVVNRSWNRSIRNDITGRSVAAADGSAAKPPTPDSLGLTQATHPTSVPRSSGVPTVSRVPPRSRAFEEAEARYARPSRGQKGKKD